MPDSPHVQTHLADGVLQVTLNRPEKKNALTRAMYAALADALGRAEAEPAIRVVLFHGAGSAFTGGNDLMDFMQDPPTDESSPVFRFLHALVRAEVPLVAAVHGPAIGIGTTMLLHCDLVYVTPDALLKMPFVDLGLIPEAASSLLLPRLVGPVKATEMLTLGAPTSGTEAVALGLANAAVDEGDLLETALENARALAARPPAAVRLTKRLIKAPLKERVEATIQEEGALFVERLASAEAAEAFSAFFEKRAPDFSQFD